jgi:hypothetical protein
VNGAAAAVLFGSQSIILVNGFIRVIFGGSSMTRISGKYHL